MNAQNIVKVLNITDLYERTEINCFSEVELAQKLGDQIRAYENVVLDLDGKQATINSTDKQAILGYFNGENGITYSVGIILLDGQYSMFTLDMATGERIVGGNSKLLDLHYQSNDLRSILEHLVGHNKKLDMTKGIRQVKGYTETLFKNGSIQSKCYARKIRETNEAEFFHFLTENGKGLVIKNKKDGNVSFQYP